MMEANEIDAHEDGPEPEVTEPKDKRPKKRAFGSPEDRAPDAQDRMRRALKNMLDNTPADATPRSVRADAEAALKG